MDPREQLASNLYRSVLDLSPQGAVALRIAHDDGLLWRVSDEALTVIVGGEEPRTYQLAGTLGGLATALAADGIDVLYINGDLAPRASATLVAGEGGGSSASQLVAFQSNLWALLDAYGVEVRAAKVNLAEALDQLDIGTSDGEFLDFWGGFFAVPRLPGENDALYRVRMVEEVLRPRSNAYAIQNTIFRLTGHHVTLREPWREIFTLNSSKLSDRDHFQDGTFFTWNVFQPIYHTELSPAERDRVIEIIERNRPAGCLLVGEYAQPPIAYGELALAFSGGMKRTHIYCPGSSHYQTNVLSSSLALSAGRVDIGSAFQWTFAGSVRRIFGAVSPLGLFSGQTWGGRGVWGDRSWLKPSICMVVTESSA